MMNIAVNNDVYRMASLYAREHNTNVEEMVEEYLRKLHPSSVEKDAVIKLQHLISLTKGMKLDVDDINGDKAKSAYLKTKYSK